MPCRGDQVSLAADGERAEADGTLGALPEQGLQHRRTRGFVTQVVGFIVIGSSGNLSENCILTDVDLLKMKIFHSVLK